ncbi:M3 family oligoendopeptidase [Ktedonospora formicarum]|uniref:Oligoendopeptidase F n=1 Tax=Ktedonospora formicarum TaxID=2778364 RepID=A0A8J3I579_9CHLR|nr:M3 family oligoendopeptidase [Ktedonospora formicarum]GHO46372.1 oligoendopeptidase F [Ktedonospora formicarum]
MLTTQELPRWDMTVIYPDMEAPEFEQGFAANIRAVDSLSALFDQHHVAEHTALTVDDALVTAFEEVIARYNEVLEHIETLYTYISCFVDTNSEDTLAQAKLSELMNVYVLLTQLGTRFTAWVGSMDVDALLARSGLARHHEHMLRRAQFRARHLMSSAEEMLASELNISSGMAWGRLHGNMTSQLKVSLDVDGVTKEYPISAVRNMGYSPDRNMRKCAYEAELAAWERVAVPLAASLNSIKNETNVLARKRGWSSALEATLFLNSIDQQTLEAMLEAARESFPDMRRYLKAKARALGLQKLAWYDLQAPIGQSEKSWSFEEAQLFIIEQFGSYSPRLAGLAEQAFNERWIDAEPRPGKIDGAYCAGLRPGESRVLANYSPSYDSVSTLAHELGHAYHNLNMRDRTTLQSGSPMTLAETASIFCETIIRNAALKNASKQEQLAILASSLQNSCMIVVDITSRFLFEQGVFEKRQQRELSVDELKELMLDTQRLTYGDGLDEAALHPYMWAVKGHYYNSDYPYYNYPYMFGLLFGLGLYTRYQQDPEGFKQGYDDLLSLTGMVDAATLAARFGIDIRTKEFWCSSLDNLRKDIDRFEELVKTF